MHTDRDIVIPGTRRSDFRINFFNAAFERDPVRILEKQGANTQHVDMIRFLKNAQVAKMEPVDIA